jgi:glycosyltransferase involved in cell wall biosynthesis
MTIPLVSCIIPCFNGERYLEEAIRSILAQTHRPIEVIVVDDGSTDGSATLVRGFAEPVRYRYQENRGPAGACNTGLELAAGEYVAFLEQDDLWLPFKLRRQLDEFEANPRLGYCVGHIQNFWVPELRAEAQRHADAAVMRPVPGYVSQTLMVRRDLFDRVGRFDESLRFAFASEWFLRADDGGAAGVLIDDVLTRRRLHEHNFSRRNRAASHEQFLHVVKGALDRRRAQSGP